MRSIFISLYAGIVSASDPCGDLCRFDGPSICTGGSYNKNGVCQRYVYLGNPADGVYCYHTSETAATCPSNGLPVRVEDVARLIAGTSTTTYDATSEQTTTIDVETNAIEDATEIATDETRRAAFGIYPIRPRTSWMNDDGDLLTFYHDIEMPQGDLVLYLFDALSGAYSFEAASDSIERFVTEFRSRNTEATVWFVYDDGGNLDAEAVGDFLVSFRTFLESVSDREALGRLGVMINTEEMKARALIAVITAESATIRDSSTFLGLSIHTYEPATLKVGLEHTDMVLVSIHGTDAASVADNAEEFLNSNHRVLVSNQESQARIGFKVTSEITQPALEIAEALFERVHAITPLVDPRTVLTVYNWEQWGRE